jgi:hypothetical protein
LVHLRHCFTSVNALLEILPRQDWPDQNRLRSPTPVVRPVGSSADVERDVGVFPTVTPDNAHYLVMTGDAAASMWIACRRVKRGDLSSMEMSNEKTYSLWMRVGI